MPFEDFGREESLGFHGYRTQLALFGALERRLGGARMSAMQYLALRNLVGADPISQSELGQRLFITGATTVRLVDRLVRDGWVVREAHPADGRVKLLVPTQKAKQVWQDIKDIGDEVLEGAYQGIEPAEIEQVKLVLARVRQNLGADV